MKHFICFFVIVISYLHPCYATTKSVGLRNRDIVVVILNECHSQDSTLQQKITITNESKHGIWFCSKYVSSSLSPIGTVLAQVYTSVGAYSSKPKLGYMAPYFIPVEWIEPHSKIIVPVSTDIPYTFFQKSTLIVDVDFIEYSEAMETSLIKLPPTLGLGEIAIPYEEYETNAMKFTVSVNSSDN